jgi:hypothetical protein
MGGARGIVTGSWSELHIFLRHDQLSVFIVRARHPKGSG